jgi:hypothetical protein
MGILHYKHLAPSGATNADSFNSSELFTSQPAPSLSVRIAREQAFRKSQTSIASLYYTWRQKPEVGGGQTLGKDVCGFNYQRSLPGRRTWPIAKAVRCFTTLAGRPCVL